MAKKHIVYHEKVHDEEVLIYFIEDENTGRKKYYVLDAVPDKYQRNQEALERINAEIQKYNAEENKNARLMSLTPKNGEKRWYVEEPSSAMGALIRAYKVDREIKKEQKIIEEINKPVTTGVVSSGNKFKKATGAVKAKAIAIGLAATILVGSIAGITALGNRGDEGLNNNDTTIAEQVKPPIYNDNWNAGPNTSISPDTTVSPEVEEQKVYTDLDTLTFDTYVSSGKTFVEVDDMLKIAEACYGNLEIELENANHNYDFDVSKFKPEMYVGEAIQESSLKYVVDYVNKYGCRGMFMIGTDATKEANEVSKKLTGKEIISDSKELDNPVEAMMTCMYISVRNFEYCAEIVGAENVTPNMVYDCYLFGCGNVRSWLRACMVNGKYNGEYKPQTYSQKVLYYGECLEPYNDALKQGLTNGEHDSYWQDLHVNRLWKLPNFEAEVENERE